MCYKVGFLGPKGFFRPKNIIEPPQNLLDRLDWYKKSYYIIYKLYLLRLYNRIDIIDLIYRLPVGAYYNMSKPN